MRRRVSCLRMRFVEKRAPTPAMKDVDASLKPVPLPADYAPFPLPKYDQSMGFGPSRVQHVPDIARSKRTLLEEIGRVNEMMNLDNTPTLIHESVTSSGPEGVPAVAAYVQEEGFPLLDRLVCNRSLQDLLRQYDEHPSSEGKAAAVSDISSSLKRFSNEDLHLLFTHLADKFDPDGLGLNFLARKLYGFQTPFFVPGPLFVAFTEFIASCDAHFLEDSGMERFEKDPALVISMLRFFAIIKIFEPSKWHSPSARQLANTADSLNPKGHNRHHYAQNLFVQTFEQIEDMIAETDFITVLSIEQQAVLMGVLSAIRPDGSVSGPVANKILIQFVESVKSASATENSSEWSKSREEAIGRMAFAATMANATVPALEKLADACTYITGDLLLALSRRKPLSKEVFTAQLRSALTNTAGRSPGDLVEIYRGAQSVLQAVEDIDEACALDRELKLSAASLRPHFSRVADALELPANTRSSLFTYYSHPSRLRSLTSVSIVHSSVLLKDANPLIAAIRQLRTGRLGLIVTAQTISALQRHINSPNERKRERCRRALQILQFEIARGRICFIPFSEELRIRDAGHFADEDVMVWSIVAKLVHDAPMTRPRMMILKSHEAAAPYHFLKKESYTRFTEKNYVLAMNPAFKKSQVGLNTLSTNFSSRELTDTSRLAHLHRKIKDRPSTIRNYNVRRARLAYRRDRALFDKVRVHARNNAPGFGPSGATNHDLRGLGIHTPDHPQPLGELPCVVTTVTPE